MKTKIPLLTALLAGLTGVAGAFSLDLVGYEGATLPPNPTVLSVPGYGDVVCEAAAGPTLVVSSAYRNDEVPAAPSLVFNEKEAVKVSFTGRAPVAASEGTADGQSGEGFGARQITSATADFPASGKDGQSSSWISWTQVPEPASAMLGLLGVLLILFRRGQ